jgi:predicted transcriptional regulator
MPIVVIVIVTCITIIIIVVVVPKENITSDSLLTTNMASESTVRDSQPSLDLASATSGDKIVTAQVSELLLYLI